MTKPSKAEIEKPKDMIEGCVLTPEDSEYDNARRIWNGMIDRRPAVIVQPADSADVEPAITFARGKAMEIAVKGAGHNIAGNALCDGGLTIDFANMREVRVDPAKSRAYVAPGATLADLDAATQRHGLATPVGINSTTGVAGLTLGGGFGWLTRKYGMTVDNLMSADVVTADGRKLRASEKDNPELFWALRGGGGNFGVVTSFEFQLHEVGDIVGGPICYEVDDAAAVLQCYREFIANAPEQLGCFFGWQIAPPLPFIPENRHGDLFCVLVTCWNGPPEEAEKVLRPLRDVAEVKAEQVGVMPFPALNSAFDDLVPKGMQYYWKADFVTELSDEAIAAHVEHGKKTPHVSSSMHLHPINGAAQRVGADETAFGHRDKRFAPVIAGIWSDPADNEANIKWVKDYYAAIHPHSGSDGGYINFMSSDDDHRAAANYGTNYERLAAVKATYDPDNLFHVNQNIVPAKRS